MLLLAMVTYQRHGFIITYIISNNITNISSIVIQGRLKLRNHHGDDSRVLVNRTNSAPEGRDPPDTQETQHSSVQTWLRFTITWGTLRVHSQRF